MPTPLALRIVEADDLPDTTEQGYGAYKVGGNGQGWDVVEIPGAYLHLVLIRRDGSEKHWNCYPPDGWGVSGGADVAASAARVIIRAVGHRLVQENGQPQGKPRPNRRMYGYLDNVFEPIAGSDTDGAGAWVVGADPIPPLPDPVPAPSSGPSAAEIVQAIAQAMSTRGSLLNSAFVNMSVALGWGPTTLPANLLTVDNLGSAFAGSKGVMDQLDNRVYATLLKNRVLEGVYKLNGWTWPPPTPIP